MVRGVEKENSMNQPERVEIARDGKTAYAVYTCGHVVEVNPREHGARADLAACPRCKDQS